MTDNRIVWCERSRQLDESRIYLSPKGYRNQTFTYAAAIYRVCEDGYRNGRVVGYRERYEVGPALYAHEDGDAAMLMEAIRPLMNALLRRCAKKDAKRL